MNPIVTMEMAQAELDERRRDADAWRATRDIPRPLPRWRPTLGNAVTRLGARIAGDLPTPDRTRRRVATPRA